MEIIKDFIAMADYMPETARKNIFNVLSFTPELLTQALNINKKIT